MVLKTCVKDSDCFAISSAPTTAEQAGTCCAYMKINSLDTTKTAHATYLAGLVAGGYPSAVGDKVYYCEDNYPTSFGSSFIKDDKVADGSVWDNAGIYFTAYCDGSSTLVAGSLSVLSSILYISLY